MFSWSRDSQVRRIGPRRTVPYCAPRRQGGRGWQVFALVHRLGPDVNGTEQSGRYQLRRIKRSAVFFGGAMAYHANRLQAVSPA